VFLHWHFFLLTQKFASSFFQLPYQLKYQLNEIRIYLTNCWQHYHFSLVSILLFNALFFVS
jgi:hypothetical protein